MKAPSLLLLSVSLTSCAAASLVVDAATGKVTRLEAVADDLAGDDVVFVGEDHGNDVGHRLQLRVVQLLHGRRPDLVLSMEMFERDVQRLLDDYLAGLIDERTFLAGARPWPNYRRHYRPIVEFARRHGIFVLAANVPRRLAREVSARGPAAVQPGPDMARETTAPRDEYWEAFGKAVEKHAGASDEQATYRMYQAQCLKDDTMAESIADYLRKAHRRGERPLVVHLCGRFHSDHGRGTVARLRSRLPDLEVGLVTMRSMRSVRLPPPGAGHDADYILVVRGEPD